MKSTLATAIPPRTQFLRARVAFDKPETDARARWASLRRLESLLSVVPASCFQELCQASGGFLCLTSGETEYRPGPDFWGTERVPGVARIDTATFADDARPGLRAIARLLDHYLGSLFGQPARYLSEQAPGVHGWDDVHRRLLAAHRLGYTDDPEALADPAAYWRWAWADYILEPAHLIRVDPEAHRLMHSTLFSAAFWRGYPRQRCRTEAIVC